MNLELGEVFEVADQERQASPLMAPKACVRGDQTLGPSVVRQVDDNWRRCAAHDNPSKRFQFRRVDFHMRQEGRDMNKIAGLRAC